MADAKTDAPDIRDTEEAKMFPDGGVIQKPLVTDGTFERLPPGTDSTTVLPSTRKRLGITEDYVLKWEHDVQGTPYWRDKVTSDPIFDMLDTVPGSEVVLDPARNNQPVRKRDVVLMKVPRRYWEEQERIKDYEARKFHRQLTDEELEGDNRKQSDRDRKRLTDLEHQAMHNSGMIGPQSPTYQMNLKDAIKMMESRNGPNAVAEESRKYREGNRPSTRDVLEETRDRAASAAKGRRTYGGLGGLLSKK